jgi:hypothetical protein
MVEVLGRRQQIEAEDSHGGDYNGRAMTLRLKRASGKSRLGSRKGRPAPVVARADGAT